MKGNFHEHWDRPDVPLPSDRSTGVVFTVVALLVAFIWRENPTVLYIALAVAAVLAAICVIRPSLLHPLNVVWMRFALLLSKIINPIVMLLLFAVAIVPAGLIMQLLRDPLRKRRVKTTSYWIPVDAEARKNTSTMSQQF